MDIDKMAQMMKIINSFSNKETSDNYKLIKAMESAVSFSNEENRKKFNTLIKYIEINDIINKYKNYDVGVQSEKSDWHKKVLLDIRGQLNEKKQNIIDFAIKLSELAEIMKNINSSEN